MQILALKSGEPTESINLNKETEGSSSNRSESSSEIRLDNISASRPFFPSSIRPIGLAQLFQNPSRPDLQSQKIDPTIKEESFTNMFCGIDDQTGFWPWLDKQHFN